MGQPRAEGEEKRTHEKSPREKGGQTSGSVSGDWALGAPRDVEVGARGRRGRPVVGQCGEIGPGGCKTGRQTRRWTRTMSGARCALTCSSISRTPEMATELPARTLLSGLLDLPRTESRDPSGRGQCSLQRNHEPQKSKDSPRPHWEKVVPPRIPPRPQAKRVTAKTASQPPHTKNSKEKHQGDTTSWP